MSLHYLAMWKFASGAGTATMDLASGGSDAASLEVHTIVHLSPTLNRVQLRSDNVACLTDKRAGSRLRQSAAHIAASQSAMQDRGRLPTDVSYSTRRSSLMAAMCDGMKS